MAYTWTSSVGKHDESMSISKAGMEANPSRKSKKEFADVYATYDKFLALLRTQLETLEQTTTTASTSTSTAVPNGSGHSAATAEAGVQSTFSSFNSQASDEKPPKHAELHRLKREYGLAWIIYMRFGRRSEGMKSLRGIFGRARKDRWVPWEVYEASALMEYHCYNDKTIASRIFERGLDSFGEEIDYVIRYLSFLISINDNF